MGSSFACPECGNSLQLRGSSPGRRVRCDWCRTWVEVPFLPRMLQQRRAAPRPRAVPSWILWAWGGVGLTTVLLLVLGTTRMLQARSRQSHERALVRLCDAAQQDERRQRFGPALAELEAALAEAARIEPRDDAQLDRLRGWHDRVACQDVASQLAALAGLAPEPALGACLALRARVSTNTALTRFEQTIDEQLDRSRQRWVEADLAAAREAQEAGDAVKVIELCERLVENANALAAPSTSDCRRHARAEADAMVALTISRRGVILGSIQGQFALGSDPSYESNLHPLLADALRHHGYVVRPASSFWDSLWGQLARYHLMIAVAEQQPGTYLHSPNRISSIKVSLVLAERGKSQAIWEDIVNARTRVPLPRLAAYQASRLAFSDHRDPAIEQLFYKDARMVLEAQLLMRLHSLPELHSSLSATGVPARHS